MGKRPGHSSRPANLLHEALELQGVRSLALPDDQHLPTRASQRLFVPVVAAGVRLNLLPPELGVRLDGAGAVHARWAAVPEAPVDEDAEAARREDYIGLPGEPRVVNAVAETGSMEEPPHDEFEAGIAAADARHDLASPLG